MTTQLPSLSPFRRGILLTTAAALVLCTGGGVAAKAADSGKASNTAQTAPENAGPSITGFRGADFGMTQAQVRQVIESEFKLPVSAITATANDIQHTAVLNVQVPELFPGSGAANVSYIFGYQSHQLIQVSVFWSKQSDPGMTPQMLYQNGESLQQYFSGEGFPPDRSSGNIATGSGIILFRASDSAQNAVLLVLSGTLAKDAKAPGKTVLTPAALTLVYAATPQHPDIFQLPKGAF